MHPTPPHGLLPTQPSLGKQTTHRYMLLQVLAPRQRAVLLRDRAGSILSLTSTDAAGRALIEVPPSGALLDVLGTDVLGLPITAGLQLTIVVD